MESSKNTSVLDVIKTLLPDGTNLEATGWDDVCEWPPDLFAAVASIADRSGLYSERVFTAFWAPEFMGDKQYIAEVQDAGAKWAELGLPPDLVRDLWRRLIRQYRNAQTDDVSSAAIAWKTIVYKLLAIADEACFGVGFSPQFNSKSGSAPVNSEPASPDYNDATKLAYIVYEDYLAWEVKRAANSGAVAVGGEVLPYLPHSLCRRVPPTVACVQPKTNTPAFGCTLRSLTHHLALLPSTANVTTHWQIANKPDEDLSPINLLLVPFPFSVPGRSFTSTAGLFPTKDRAFKLDPSVWMRGATPQDFSDFLLKLIEAAALELEPVHAIVLPETALTLEFADEVAAILSEKSGLDLFLTGVLVSSNGEARNSAATYRFSGNKVVYWSFQSKHHRWCLNDDQIRRYQLGHVLDPDCKWWEQIDVSYRNCYVTLFRAKASLSVLICEDLARYDPVLTVMNAVGPNLVIALLMDGPQLEQRWPGRYATALADDPGSSVLTLTSLGMVSRSAMPGEPQNREVALWKEPNGRAQALKLPKGDHALLLTLTSKVVEQFTLDGRGDHMATVHFGLGAAHGVRHPSPPGWLQAAP